MDRFNNGGPVFFYHGMGRAYSAGFIIRLGTHLAGSLPIIPALFCLLVLGSLNHGLSAVDFWAGGPVSIVAL